jgi:hypothetical protein
MSSKARIRFLNRLAHYEADVELADVLSIAAKNGTLASSTAVFNGVEKKKHPRLAARLNTPKSREIALGHLTNTLHGSFIKDIYEDFTAYLLDILKASARKGLNPDRLIGDHKFSVDANQLLALGSWDAVTAFVSDTLFRRIEGERSTVKLISALDAKLALKLPPATVNAAMPYLDLRHLLVHRDGVADRDFCAKYPKFGLKEGNSLEVGHKVVSAARQAVKDLVHTIDAHVLTAGLLHKSDIHKHPAPVPPAPHATPPRTSVPVEAPTRHK